MIQSCLREYIMAQLCLRVSHNSVVSGKVSYDTVSLGASYDTIVFESVL